MATNNAPKHDFAPAWLKIPSQEHSKPTSSRHSDQSSDKTSRKQKEDHRYPQDSSKLYRQHSFENYYDNKKPSTGTTKNRHHSVDDDFYAYPPYGYYSDYGYSYEKYGMQYGSQPTLFRPPNRDGKYQNSNARFGQLNGTYQNYYDLYPYDNFHGDPYCNWYNGRPNSKKTYGERDARNGSKDSKDRESETKDKENGKEKSLKDDDFPSLNGASEDTDYKNSKPSSNSGGVWDHPPIGKSYRSFDEDRDGKYNNMCKTLLPNKPAVSRKTTKEGIRFNGGFKDYSKPTNPSSGFNKEVVQPPTPPIDILNTRFVTQPKNLGDKKSDFLRALRQEDKSVDHSDKKDDHDESNNNEEKRDHMDTAEDIFNGIDSLNIDDSGSSILSSSMEAEQRLLKEMGWKEEDGEDEYEITEAEMKEFKNLSQKVKQEKNGFVRQLPKSWSPKHVPVYQQLSAQPVTDIISSSDSDSDDSC